MGPGGANALSATGTPHRPAHFCLLCSHVFVKPTGFTALTTKSLEPKLAYSLDH